jgi:hypothetical protein
MSCKKSVETSEECKLTTLQNQQVQTDIIIPNNKQDIIIRDNVKGTYMLMGIVSGDLTKED